LSAACYGDSLLVVRQPLVLATEVAAMFLLYVCMMTWRGVSAAVLAATEVGHGAGVAVVLAVPLWGFHGSGWCAYTRAMCILVVALVKCCIAANGTAIEDSELSHSDPRAHLLPAVVALLVLVGWLLGSSGPRMSPASESA